MVTTQTHANLLPQYVLAVIVNLLSFTYGAMTGWVAPMQPLLQANYTNTNESHPLGEDVNPLTHEDISWIGGYFCIGGMLGTILYGYLASSLGRKKTATLAATPFVMAFGLFLAANSAYYIFAARFIAGLGAGGVCVIVPLYVGETAEASVRGALGSYFNLFYCIGILCSYIVGSYTSYLGIGIFAISCPLVFMLASMWLPESPIFSLLNNKAEEARSTLVKLRGAQHVELIDRELEEMKSSVKQLLTTDEDMSFGEMLKDIATRRGLLLGGVLMSIQQFSGISPLLNFTVVIFRASGSTISPNLATIIIGCLQLVGALIGTGLMDRAGRKFLLLSSSVGMAVTLTAIAVFFHLQALGTHQDLIDTIYWLPVTSMGIYIILYALGFGPVPFVLVGEIFKAEARSAATSFCVLLTWFIAFLLLKFFAALEHALGIAACFAMFSAFCVLGSIFTIMYVPETKGKSLEFILWELTGKKEGSSRRGSPIPLVEMQGRMVKIVRVNVESGINSIQPETIRLTETC